MSAGKQYVVKAVPTGSQLTLISKGGASLTECSVGIAGITTPRLPKGVSYTQDPAREALRKLLIGKTVNFDHLFSEEKIKRAFGALWFDGKNVGEFLVKEGHAEVNTRDKERVAGIDELLELQTAAKAAKIGRWADNAPTPKELASTEADSKLANSLKGKTNSGVVDAVLSATRLRVCLKPSFQMVTVSMAGIIPGKGFNDEAKFFTERALLHREVKIKFEGVDERPKNSNSPSDDGVTLLGSVVMGAKCFQTELLSRGLASVLAATCEKTEFRKELRSVELQARQAGVNCFGKESDKKIVKTLTDTDKPFVATLATVHNGDSVTLKTEDGQLIKVVLANCRANKVDFGDRDNKKEAEEPKKEEKPKPKAKGKGKKAEEPKEKEAPAKIVNYKGYAFEAREYLRSLFGQKLNILPEYRREESKDGAARFFVTVKVGERNINKEMLEQGLCSFVSGPIGDAREMGDEMRNTADDAKSKLKGLHKIEAASDAEKKKLNIGTNKFEDIFKPKEDKARIVLNKLQRTSRMKGIVEAVLNPARYRILIPSQGLIASVAVGGVSTPSLGRDGDADEPFAKEAMEFAKENLFQRDVEVDIKEVDGSGCFFGNVYIGSGKASEEVAAVLLKKGFGSPVGKESERAILKAAADEGQKASVGLWSIPEGERPANIRAAARDAARGTRRQWYGDVNIVGKELRPKKLSGAISNFGFEGMTIQQDASKLAVIAEDIKATSAKATDNKSSLKKGQHVLARFSADKSLYRAVVTKTGKGDKKDKVTVKYIDWGNSETLARKEIFSGDAVEASIKKNPYAATEIGLAFIVPPRDDEDLAACSKALQAYYKGVASINLSEVYTNSDNNPMCIVEKDGAKSLQETVLSGGQYRLKKWFKKQGGRKDYVTSDKKDNFVTELQSLWAAEEKAHKDHTGIWRSGDVGSDDEM